MKKVVSSILAIILLLSCVVSFAEEDYSSMTDDDLLLVLSHVRNEISRRSLDLTDKTVLYDDGGVTVYIDGEYHVSSSFLRYDLIVINDRDAEMHVFSVPSYKAYINGWEVYMGTPGTIAAGKKKKAELSFKLDDAFISSVDEIEEIEFVIDVMEAHTYERIGSPRTIILTFDH